MAKPLTRKSCVVPRCTSTTVKTPKKLFFQVPRDPNMREKWFKAAKRADPIAAKSSVYCCEDHFDVYLIKKMSYKYCIVPKCKNTTISSPNKLFLRVPGDQETRKIWCSVMKRNLPSIKSACYCCEDHFDIETDTQNYIKYKIWALEHGQKMSLMLKKGVVPHKFDCQKKPPLAASKRERKRMVEDSPGEDTLKVNGPEDGTKKLPNDMSNDMEFHESHPGKTGSDVKQCYESQARKSGSDVKQCHESQARKSGSDVKQYHESQARKSGSDVKQYHESQAKKTGIDVKLMVKKLKRQLIEECEEEIKRSQKELRERTAAEKGKGAKATSSVDHCERNPAALSHAPELPSAEEEESSLHEELCLLSSPLHIKDEEEIEDPLTGISPTPDVKLDIELDENPASGLSSPIDLEENSQSESSPSNIKEEQDIDEDTTSNVEDYEALLKLQQEVAELKTENQNLVKENKMLTDITRNFINDNLETESGQKQYIVATTETVGIINKLKDENIKLAVEKLTLSTEVNILKVANQKLAEDKLKLRKDIKRLSKEIEKKNKEIGKYTDVIQKLTEKNVAFLKKIKKLSEIQGLNERILKSTESCKMAEKHEKVQSLDENKLKSTEEYKMTEKNKELTEKIHSLHKKIEDLNKEIVELKNKKTKDNENQLDGQKSRKPQNFKELIQIRSLTEENQNLTEQIEALNEELEKCRRRKAVRVSKRRRLV